MAGQQGARSSEAESTWGVPSASWAEASRHQLRPTHAQLFPPQLPLDLHSQLLLLLRLLPLRLFLLLVLKLHTTVQADQSTVGPRQCQWQCPGKQACDSGRSSSFDLSRASQ